MNVDRVVHMLTLGLILGGVAAAMFGWRSLSGSRGLRFHNLRRDRLRRGWSWIVAGIALLLAGVVTGTVGRSVGHRAFPPTPTITLSPTVTRTPTLTRTPTVTLTPRETLTPTPTSLPVLPQPIAILVRETITPPAGAAFSPIVVASRLDEFNRPLDGASQWTNPPARLFGAFTYDQLQDGVRWTGLWRLGDQVVCEPDTQIWDGGTGGYGYTECEPLDGWKLGTYEIQLFLGDQWRASSTFEVVGEPQIPASGTAPAPNTQ